MAVAAALAFCQPAGAGEGTGALRWPLDIDSAPTSTFGEYRSGHFHAGLDLTTWGKTGLPVRAVGDGHVTRVRASGVGYGRAVYLELAGGGVVVYAHLSGFPPALATYVRSEQEARQTYEVDLFPPRGRFRFRRGDLVGYTGESGAGPPHLHFELRNRAADVAINPLLAGYRFADREPPRLTEIEVLPASSRSLVEGGPDPVVRHLQARGAGSYVADTVSVTGNVALSVGVIDRADGRQNPLAVHRLDLLVDGELLYASSLDSIAYASQREVDLVYDALRARSGDRTWRRLHRMPGSRCAAHRSGDGIIRSDGSEVPLARRVEIVAADYAGNESRAELVLVFEPASARAESAAAMPAAAPQVAAAIAVPASPADSAGLEEELRVALDHVDLRLRAREALTGVAEVRIVSASGEIATDLARPDPHTLAVRFDPGAEGPLSARLLTRRPGGDLAAREVALPLRGVVAGSDRSVQWPGAELEMAADALFADACLWGERVTEPAPPPAGLEPVSPAFELSPQGYVFREPVTLWLGADSTAGDLADRVGLYRQAGDHWSWVGSHPAETRVGAPIREAGRYRLLRDLAPPDILRRFPASGTSVRNRRPYVAVRLRDQGSGLQASGIHLWLDGVLQIAEWDPEAGAVRAHLAGPLATGRHAVRVAVSDRAGNRTEATYSFTVATP